MNPPFFVFSANSPSKYELSAVCLGKVRLDVIADVEPVVGKRKTVAYAYGLIVWLFIDIGSIAHLAVQIPSYSYLQGEMSEIDFMAQRKSHYVPAMRVLRQAAVKVALAYGRSIRGIGVVYSYARGVASAIAVHRCYLAREGSINGVVARAILGVIGR